MDEAVIETERESVDLEERVSKDNRSSFVKATDVYFKPTSFEKSGRVYEWLGIKPFKKLVMGTVGKALGAIGLKEIVSYYFIGRGDKKDVSAYETWTRFPETLHTLGILATNLPLHLSEGNISGALSSSLALLINGYCVMLQRYNRARAYRILERRGER